MTRRLPGTQEVCNRSEVIHERAHCARARPESVTRDTPAERR
jgi:hypothetical protein